MERLLLLWDELDDLSGAFGHLISSAADEMVAVAVPLAAAAGSAIGAWLLLHAASAAMPAAAIFSWAA